MTDEERKARMKQYFGKTADIKIDRSCGDAHEKDGCAVTYPVHYGHNSGMPGGDGEKPEVYLLGADEPANECKARIVGAVYGKDADDDRLIAFPDGMNFTEDMIRRSFAARELCSDTDIDIEVYGIRFCECTAHRCRIEGLPDGVLDDCAGKVIVYLSGHNFKLYTKREFEEIPDKLKDVKHRRVLAHVFNSAEIVVDGRTLFFAVFHALKRENPALSDDSVFRLRFALSDEFTEIRVIGISEP